MNEMQNRNQNKKTRGDGDGSFRNKQIALYFAIEI